MKDRIEKIIEIFEKYHNLPRTKLEQKLDEHSLLDLHIYATQIGIIPNNNKEKMIKRISFKLKK